MLPIAALAAVALVWSLIARPWDPGRPAGDEAAPPDAVAAELVRWTAAELEPDARVTVPDDLLAGVRAVDAQADRFRGDGSGDGDGDGLRLLRGEPSAGSLVLARFPVPGASPLVLVDPRPGRPTAEELDRRRRLSQAVLANPMTGATGRTADVLESGHVDPRLLGLLAALVTQLEIRIADLPPPVPGTAPLTDGPLVRTALVDRADGSAVPGDRAATDRLLAFLDAQLPPYAPDTVEVTDAGVRIAVRYASDPDALVDASAP